MATSGWGAKKWGSVKWASATTVLTKTGSASGSFTGTASASVVGTGSLSGSFSSSALAAVHLQFINASVSWQAVTTATANNSSNIIAVTTNSVKTLASVV
jgi:hypothetical protein